MLQGLTAHYLVTSVFPIAAGHTALVHAAAGGVGQLLCQMITSRGGTVIGTVSSPEKAEAALAAGAAHVIGYDDVATKVRELTAGVGVDVAYDGVGKATFDGSLAAIRRRGLLALFGAASGAPDPLELGRLSAGGSLSVTRPSLGDFTATPEELVWRASEVFGDYLDGKLTFAIGGIYPLADVAQAHRDLQGRRTMGKLLLDMEN
jgi:NADPH2:quinone reductase